MVAFVAACSSGGGERAAGAGGTSVGGSSGVGVGASGPSGNDVTGGGSADTGGGAGGAGSGGGGLTGGAGGSGGTGASGSGGAGAGGASGSGGAGGTNAVTGGSGGDGGSGGTTSTPEPSPCLPIELAPFACDEVCEAQGSTCLESTCPAVGSLTSTSFFYSDLASCEANQPVSTELFGCGSSFSGTVSFLPFTITHVRCCCDEPVAGAGDAASKGALCRNACDAARIDYTGDPACLVGEYCEPICQDTVRDLDAECAECVANALEWPPGGCGSFECYCPNPTFPPAGGTACASACGFAADAGP